MMISTVPYTTSWITFDEISFILPSKGTVLRKENCEDYYDEGYVCYVQIVCSVSVPSASQQQGHIDVWENSGKSEQSCSSSGSHMWRLAFHLGWVFDDQPPVWSIPTQAVFCCYIWVPVVWIRWSYRSVKPLPSGVVGSSPTLPTKCHSPSTGGGAV